MAQKAVLTTLRLQLQAGEASPGKVGQTLGTFGVNIMAFCRDYNAATQAQRGTIIPAEVTVYEDRSVTFVTKTPPTSALLRTAAGVDRGSGEPNRTRVGRVSRTQLREIARIKLPDLNTDDLDMAERIIAGTARSMGISIST
jgi:large subunit ribosomal protein L11